MHLRREISNPVLEKKVTSRKQAIAIGLPEAREKGVKVPSKKMAAGSGMATKKSKAK